MSASLLPFPMDLTMEPVGSSSEPRPETRSSHGLATAGLPYAPTWPAFSGKTQVIIQGPQMAEQGAFLGCSCNTTYLTFLESVKV